MAGADRVLLYYKMKIKKSFTLENILVLILFILVGIFSLSLFKNIQYPLLWNDEAATAMFTKRVLQFGYPKVHDGINILTDSQPHNPSFIFDPKTDASLENDWLQYYFSSFFLLIAQNFDDIYTQTAILRMPFAIVGMFGLAIIVFSILPSFKQKKHKLIFLTLFAFFETLSVPLVLHIREMRYYSLMIFLTSWFFLALFKFHVFHTLKSKTYYISIITALLLILITFHPAFFSFLFFLIIIVCCRLLSKNNLINTTGERIQVTSYSFRLLIPVIISLVLSIPYFIFFKTFYIAMEKSKYFHFNIFMHLHNLSQMASFFWENELLLAAIIFKILIFSLISNIRNINDKHFGQKLQVSLYLSIFFIVYSIFIARMPNYLFIRYYIVLLPVLTLVTLLDAFIVFEYVSKYYYRKKNVRLTIAALISIVFIYNIFIHNQQEKMNHVTGHVHELFHQYKGPLDYVIPYIKNQYPKTEDLVIATNYEEFSYMFYLNSKVIIGFGEYNLAEDMKMRPDIIVFRNWWKDNTTLLNNFLSKEKYRTIFFPVYDYPVNNIPEFDFNIPHLFQTKFASNRNQQLKMFIRENLNSKQAPADRIESRMVYY